tara:strand:- start:2003 stop:2614 length:612 start_codon:yes stop_codon:yes gene_type:complete
MKTTLYIFLGILFVFTAWQFYGSYTNKKYETLSNEIIGTINSIDFKIYDQYTKASVNTEAYNMNSASSNFPVLANYIFGGNKDSLQMAMTSPVLYNMSNKSSFSFIMPLEFAINNLPSPNTEKIFFETVKNQCIAVIKFSGFANEKNCAAKHLELLNVLKQNNISCNNDFMIAVYQPPYQIINRKNEIWIEVNALEVKNVLPK